ncbi:hypothetical protein KJA13_03880 [Patescibacteria group bacterium]|nr:hypothetical protein [Patescibacteria group bacterium]
MKKIFLVAFFIIFLFSFVTPVYSGLVPCGLSVDDPDQPGDQTVPCELCHLFVMFDRWVDSLLIIFVPITAALMIAIGGVMYIISQGKPEMLSKAKSLFTAVVIGLVIIYGAWVIVNTFLTIIGTTVWQGPGQGWWIFPCP